MIKKDIVNKLHKSSLCYKMSKKHAGRIVTEVFNIITEALLGKEDVQLRGFGHFRLRYRAPRKIDHPGTREKTISHPKYVILFDPAKNVKRELRLSKPIEGEEVKHG